MERQTLQVGSFEVNCSILSDNGKAWIIDPGHDADHIIDFLAKKNLAPAAIMLTHAHFDHMGGVPGLQKAFPGLPVCVHKNDIPVITHPMNQYPPDYPPIAQPKNIRSLGILEKLDALEGLGGLEIIESPGHTPGGVCYYFPDSNLLFSGDTLFAGSVGRTDLPGGDMAKLMDSLKKLAALPDDTVVVPGHGPLTTIANEKRTNPFMR